MRPRARTEGGYEAPDDALRQRDELLAIVSHDLRNPLGAIDLAAQMLDAQHHDPGSKKHLAIIRRATRRMEVLIRDLLDISSIHAGRFKVRKQPEDLAPLLGELVDGHEPLAAEKGLALARHLRVDGIRLPCDRERLGQVMANLLGNSIKFCRTGDAIAIHAEADVSCVRIIVQDSGPGISRDDLAHVFEAYWTRKRYGKQGTGLGLFICKGIVDAHGGLIDVTSKPGIATTFTITLPR